jgi:ribosome production factor 2
MLSRKNEIRPFEDTSSLEFLMDKNECALFCFASHSKKRPHNLILGRTYDKHLLDMIEFGCSSVEGLESFKETEKKRYGSKPCLVFVGEGWHQDVTLERVQNLFMGKWRGGRKGGREGREDRRTFTRGRLFVFATGG